MRFIWVGLWDVKVNWDEPKKIWNISSQNNINIDQDYPGYEVGNWKHNF